MVRCPTPPAASEGACVENQLLGKTASGVLCSGLCSNRRTATPCTCRSRCALAPWQPGLTMLASGAACARARAHTHTHTDNPQTPLCHRPAGLTGGTCASCSYMPRCSCSTRLDTSAAAAAAGSEPSAAAPGGAASVLAVLLCMNLLSWAACSLKVKPVGATIMTCLLDCAPAPAHIALGQPHNTLLCTLTLQQSGRAQVRERALCMPWEQHSQRHGRHSSSKGARVARSASWNATVCGRRSGSMTPLTSAFWLQQERLVSTRPAPGKPGPELGAAGCRLAGWAQTGSTPTLARTRDSLTAAACVRCHPLRRGPPDEGIRHGLQIVAMVPRTYARVLVAHQPDSGRCVCEPAAGQLLDQLAQLQGRAVCRQVRIPDHAHASGRRACARRASAGGQLTPGKRPGAAAQGLAEAHPPRAAPGREAATFGSPTRARAGSPAALMVTLQTTG